MGTAMSVELDSTRPVRSGEELSTERLEAYLRQHLPAGEGALAVEQFPSGHSNLTYLLLAQRMIKDDKAAALFRLGITKEAAELIETLSPAQLLKIAAGNMVLCRFRFDNRVLGDMLTGYVKNKIMASSHAAVLMAGQAAEPVAA